jgi:hypothetical protein
VADEITPSSISDLITSEAAAAEFLMLLADSDGSVLAHPALMHATAPNQTSTVVRVFHIGLNGNDLLSATTPGTEIPNTALQDGHTDVTIALRTKRYNRDDLAGGISQLLANPTLFAMDAAKAVAQTLISLIANVGDDFTSVAGTSGVDATWNDVVDAKTLLGVAKAGGPMLAIIHPQQWGDLEKDALSLGMAGAVILADTLNSGLEQYKGNRLGIDWFVSSQVPTANAGANRAGGIYTRGAIAWADCELPQENDPNIISLGRARFERVRKGEFAATNFITSHAAGVAKAIDGAGVTLKTDA